MAKINGIDLAKARMLGELCNVTSYTEATLTAYVLVDGVFSWLDRVHALTIHVRLRPGHGREDHLFDRAAATIAAAVDGQLYTSAFAAKAAAENVRIRESLGYAVEVVEEKGSADVPAELEPAAEAIRERIVKKERAAALRKLRREVAALQVLEHEGQWVLGDEYHLRHRFSTAYTLERLSPTASGYQWPMHTYASAEEAEADRAAFLAEINP